MRVLEYLVLTLICGAAAALLAIAVVKGISAAFAKGTATIEAATK